MVLSVDITNLLSRSSASSIETVDHHEVFDRADDTQTYASYRDAHFEADSISLDLARTKESAEIKGVASE